MHIAFYLYGNIDDVNRIIEVLKTRTVPLEVTDEKGWTATMQVNTVVRVGLFGTYELILPETSKDIALNTLMGNFGEDIKNFKVKARIAALRKALSLEPIPEYDKSQKWPMPQEHWQNVRVFPIGVRYDKKDITFPNGLKHEFL